MYAESSSPFRALVPSALVVLVATAAACALSMVPGARHSMDLVAVEIDPGEGDGTVVLFPEPPDQCRALTAAGFDTAGCDRAVLLQSGMALFRMPDGKLRQGQMRGADLIAMGLPIPVNGASSEDLEAIPGIGPSLAGAIVVDRGGRGRFRSASDLDRVRGIGPAKAAEIDRFVSYIQPPSGAVPPSP